MPLKPLRRLQAAPSFAETAEGWALAEVEALGELVSALAGATPAASIGLNDAPGERACLLC